MVDATGYVVAALTGWPVMDRITAAEYELPGHRSPLRLPEPADPLRHRRRARAGGRRRARARAGRPVPTGCFDTYADVAACGVRGPGDACALLGSTGVVAVCVDAPRAVRGAGVRRRTPATACCVGGWTATAGSALRWCADLLGRDEPALAAAAAALRPGAGGLLALPYLAGERTPLRDPEARGVLVGLTLGTTPAKTYRALVDAVALSVRHHLDVLRAAGLAPARLRLGGGGTRNPAWLQATADATGLELDVVAHAGEAIGPCDLALRAVGLEPVDRVAATVAPDAARAAPLRPPRAALRHAAPRPRGTSCTSSAASTSRRTLPDDPSHHARGPPARRRRPARRDACPSRDRASGELLVRVEACGVCPTDVRKFVARPATPTSTR